MVLFALWLAASGRAGGSADLQVGMEVIAAPLPLKAPALQPASEMLAEHLPKSPWEERRPLGAQESRLPCNSELVRAVILACGILVVLLACGWQRLGAPAGAPTSRSAWR